MNHFIKRINKLLQRYHDDEGGSLKDISDTHHTFGELYKHRMILCMIIWNDPRYADRAWKAKKHHDGSMFDDMFIIGMDTPDGQATYHYDLEYWDLFHVKEFDQAPEYDGHTPDQAIERLKSLMDLYH